MNINTLTPRRRWSRARMLGTAALAGVAASALSLVAATWFVPLPPELLRRLDGTLTLADSKGRPLATLASPEARAQRPVPLSEMGRWLPAVTVALEDHRFYNHGGIDPQATAGALVRNARAGRIISGGSTISQQLVKLASGRQRRSWSGKLYESFAAMRIERAWPKSRILEEYLNRSQYANRFVGPIAAAHAYFNKKPASLTVAEAIYLAGLPQAPSRFNPWKNPEAAAAKYRRSVARLANLGFLTLDQAARMEQTPPRVAPRRLPSRLAPHFVDAVLKSYPRLRLCGGVLQTTLDLDLQRFVERQLDLQLTRLAPRRVSQGAALILDVRTGAVRAMAGSRDYAGPRDGQINGAMIFRSCGSTLKPFLYLRAIEDRLLTAASLLPDTPDAVRGEYIDYDPVNYDRRFWGPVRVREALANSLNVPAVVTLSRVGACKAFSFLEECGLTFARPFHEYGAGLILGNAEVRLLDLTAAYTFLAGQGLAVEPRLLEDAPVRHRYIASPEAVAIVGDILCDNEARRKTFGPFSPLAFEDKRIPCKTGTSSGFRDTWTIGLTSEHAVGVWVGNFDGRSMEEIAAVTGAAPLWREIIDYLLLQGDTPLPAPTENARLIRRDVCRLTGLQPVAASPGVIKEWFLAGTEPTESAGSYFCTADGVTRLVLPREYALWCQSTLNYLNADVAPSTELRIVSPAPNATFVIDPHLPRYQQALRLIASGGSTEHLVWTVDGKIVAGSHGDCFWPLVEGRHTVKVASSTGCATAEFTVE